MKEGSSRHSARDRGDGTETAPAKPVYVKVHDARPDGYDGTCLRPLGLCELGGCCDTCWYRPDHPRFQSGERSTLKRSDRPA